MGISVCIVNSLIITNTMMLIIRTVMLVKVMSVMIFIIILG